MSVLTEVLKLFKYDPVADADSTFNLGQCLNDNWDNLTAALLEVLPSHVAYEYLYRYLLVREVHGMVIDTLQSHTISEFAF